MFLLFINIPQICMDRICFIMMIHITILIMIHCLLPDKKSKKTMVFFGIQVVFSILTSSWKMFYLLFLHVYREENILNNIQLTTCKISEICQTFIASIIYQKAIVRLLGIFTLRKVKYFSPKCTHYWVNIFNIYPTESKID